jgi:hypothetical protein
LILLPYPFASVDESHPLLANKGNL